MIQDERVLVRRKATKGKTLPGPYFTTRRTTFNPLYIKYDHFVHTIWLNIYVSCSLGGQNGLNRSPTPQAGDPTTGQRAGADDAEQTQQRLALCSQPAALGYVSTAKEDPCGTPRARTRPAPGASPSLVHLSAPPAVFARTPAVAAKRRERADAASEERGASRHLRQSVFGFLRFSSSSTSSPRACGSRSPSLDALHWAPAAFQPLAALEAGAGGTDAGRVVCGGTGDGDLAGAVSSARYRLILLWTANTYILIYTHVRTWWSKVSRF